MKSSISKSLLSWPLVTALVAVLVVLAVLQYRWSRQVSDAADTRMHASLQNSLMNLRQDLSRDLATLALGIRGSAGDPLDGKSLVRRWKHENDSFHGLASSVYIWEYFGDGDEQLLQPDNGDQRLRARMWPPELRKLHATMVAKIEASPAAMEPILPVDRRRQEEHEPFIVAGIYQAVPLLIIPASPAPTTRWMLIQLDSNVLWKSVMPQIAQRYFGDRSSSEYEIVVQGLGPSSRNLLFSSDPNYRGEELPADESVNLFGPVMFNRNPGLKSVEHAQPPALPPGSSPGAPGRDEASFFGPVRFDPIYAGTNDGDWRVIARHRQGSVAAAVDYLRVRNLAISFGVLLLLAASMALIILNSYRAHRLARLQMEFVAGVSHELRTPVSVILAMSDNIATRVSSDPGRVAEYGAQIRAHARQLHHLIEQVLQFSSLKSGRKIDVVPVEVSAVVDDALRGSASQLSSASINVERRISGDLLVRADPVILSQCLQNLISNAVKYGGSAKWIGIRADSVPPRNGSAADVRITVSDKGIGIRPEELQQIFDPFYRGAAVSESNIHGTGLGLALAKNYAEAMGGALTAESKVGVGSSFTIQLPAVDSEPDTLSRT